MGGAYKLELGLSITYLTPSVGQKLICNAEMLAVTGNKHS